MNDSYSAVSKMMSLMKEMKENSNDSKVWTKEQIAEMKKKFREEHGGAVNASAKRKSRKAQRKARKINRRK